MVGSPRHPRRQNEEQREENEREEKNNKPHQQRLCDFCGESKALLYCRADIAKLCFNCDREVHSTNQLFTKHTRSQLCDICDSKPASIFCSTENLVLCQNCDWDSHDKSFSSVHDRRSLEGFTGCPSAIELCSILGFEDLKGKSLLSDGFGDGYLLDSELCVPTVAVDGFSDLLVWETPHIFSIDDLIGSTDSNQNFQAMGIPPLPKNRNAACGKYKEEVLGQLSDMMKLESCFINDHEDFDSFIGNQPLVPQSNLQPGIVDSGFKHDVEPIIFPTYGESESQWKGNSGEVANQILVPATYLGSYAEESSLVLDTSNDVGESAADAKGDLEKRPQHSIMREVRSILPKVTPHESINRDTLISRYKQKRKTRRYDKHIRYESRKARAEARSRIRGRFAKADQ